MYDSDKKFVLKENWPLLLGPTSGKVLIMVGSSHRFPLPLLYGKFSPFVFGSTWARN